MTRSLNVTVPHKLSQEEAFTRVLSWLQSQNKPDPHVTLKQTNVNHTMHTVQVILEAYGYSLDILFDVGANAVTVTSNAATGLVESIGMRWQGWQFQKQLGEVLK